jgi:pimeloyl-ACP methyl ester carboxylesterase
MSVMHAATILSAAVLLGAQQVEIAPAPGRLVDLGSRQLHLHCTGAGGPTVIIEAGASAFAIDFSLVQPEVARTTRVCSYDRAGSGWSDPRPDVDTPIRVVHDLRALLDRAGEKPPFVMVGASRTRSSRASATASSFRTRRCMASPSLSPSRWRPC